MRGNRHIVLSNGVVVAGIAVDFVSAMEVSQQEQLAGLVLVGALNSAIKTVTAPSKSALVATRKSDATDAAAGVSWCLPAWLLRFPPERREG